MLILSRKRGEVVKIGDNVSVKIIGVDGYSVRLGFEAPIEISVHREEVYDRIQREKTLEVFKNATTDTTKQK